MKCKKCGKELSEDAKFCPACGTAVVRESVDSEKTETKVESTGSSSFRKYLKMAVPICLVLIVLGGGIWYYMNFVRDGLKNLEYNFVVFEDKNTDLKCSIYYDKDSIIVKEYRSESTGRYCVYELDDKYWCANGNQEDYEYLYEVPEKKLFTKLLYDIPRLKSKYRKTEKAIRCKSKHLDTDTLEKIYNLVYDFDMNDTPVFSKSDSVKVYIESGKIYITYGDIKIYYGNVEDEIVMDSVKELIRAKYDSGWLEGVYHPNGDMNVTAQISSNNVCVEDDFTVSMVVNINGEEKHFPYSSCDWHEDGCVIDGTVYVMDKTYKHDQEVLENMDRLNHLLSNGDYYVKWDTNDLSLMWFGDVYVISDKYFVKVGIEGRDEKAYRIVEDGRIVYLVESDSDYPDIYGCDTSIPERGIDYHNFFKIKR